MQRYWSKSQNIFILMICLYIIFCFLLVDNVNAQMNPKDAPKISESKNTPSGSPIWGPPSALPEKFDWIQLTSGEWLKGDLKVLYDKKLEFDSDELDLLELDLNLPQSSGHTE